MRRQSRPSSPAASAPLVVLVLFLLRLFPGASARTIDFGASNSALVYAPASAWNAVNGGAMEARTNGASVSFQFAGEQVVVKGAKGPQSGTYQVTLDGTTETFSATSASATSSSPVILFKASDLARGQTHSFVMTLADSSGALLSVSDFFISYSTSTGLIPSLVAGGASSPLSTSTAPSTPSSSATTISGPAGGTLSSKPSSTTQSSTSGAPSSTASASSPANRSATSAGAIAGGVVGGLFGVALIAYAIYYFVSRERAHPQQTWDPEVGNGHPDSAAATEGGMAQDGGVGSAPARVGRSPSWRQRMDRLRITRTFYGVPGAESSSWGLRWGDPPPLPPPTMPLPMPPPPPVPHNAGGNSSVLMMAEAYPPRLPVSRGGSRPSSPYSVAAQRPPPPRQPRATRPPMPPSTPSASQAALARPSTSAHELLSPHSANDPYFPLPYSHGTESPPAGDLRRRGGSTDLTANSFASGSGAPAMIPFSSTTPEDAGAGRRRAERPSSFQRLQASGDRQKRDGARTAARGKRRDLHSSYASQDDYYLPRQPAPGPTVATLPEEDWREQDREDDSQLAYRHNRSDAPGYPP